ncbi:hypothetical protein [Micromonospora craterilacus]|uniref:hypothetical protein n=1 Tax=Micromonospora craterilacus TaxID=1655439 RepID=UPI0011B4A9B8|nr:hypothetical protein [Micromonospora craterilacus]
MDKLIAGSLGALVSMAAVILGAWLHGVRERRQWRRDQMLRAAVDFITPTRYLLNHYRWLGEEGMNQDDRHERRGRMQNARTAVHLLYSPPVVQLMEELVSRLHETTPATASEEFDRTQEMFRDLVKRLRVELGGRLSTP